MSIEISSCYCLTLSWLIRCWWQMADLGTSYFKLISSWRTFQPEDIGNHCLLESPQGQTLLHVTIVSLCACSRNLRSMLFCFHMTVTKLDWTVDQIGHWSSLMLAQSIKSKKSDRKLTYFCQSSTKKTSRWVIWYWKLRNSNFVKKKKKFLTWSLYIPRCKKE